MTQRPYVIDELISAKASTARIEELSREIKEEFAQNSKLVVVGLLSGIPPNSNASPCSTNPRDAKSRQKPTTSDLKSPMNLSSVMASTLPNAIATSALSAKLGLQTPKSSSFHKYLRRRR